MLITLMILSESLFTLSVMFLLTFSQPLSKFSASFNEHDLCWAVFHLKPHTETHTWLWTEEYGVETRTFVNVMHSYGVWFSWVRMSIFIQSFICNRATEAIKSIASLLLGTSVWLREICFSNKRIICTEFTVHFFSWGKYHSMALFQTIC